MKRLAVTLALAAITGTGGLLTTSTAHAAGIYYFSSSPIITIGYPNFPIPVTASVSINETTTPCPAGQPAGSLCSSGTGAAVVQYAGSTKVTETSVADPSTLPTIGCYTVLSAIITFDLGGGNTVTISNTGSGVACPTSATTGTIWYLGNVTNGTGAFSGLVGSGLTYGTYTFTSPTTDTVNLTFTGLL